MVLKAFSMVAAVASFFPEPQNLPAGVPGLWHEMPMVAAGYARIYALLEDGSFVWRENEMDGEARLRERSGCWSMEGDTLVLLVSTDLMWEGGTLQPATGSTGTDSELTGFTPMYIDYFVPEEVRIEASTPVLVESDSDPDLPADMWRMVIAGEDYWRLSSDPETMREILVRGY